MDFGIDNYGPLSINPRNFGDPLTFPLPSPQGGESLCLCVVYSYLTSPNRYDTSNTLVHLPKIEELHTI